MVEKITEFQKEYRFLSNFYQSDAGFYYKGIRFTNAEAAYQGSKSKDKRVLRVFSNLDPGEAKVLGRNMILRDDWEEVKYGIMKEIVKAKFENDGYLTRRLLETGDAKLVEGNWWGDKIWGVCLKTGEGENNLGKILMEVRQELKSHALPLT